MCLAGGCPRFVDRPLFFFYVLGETLFLSFECDFSRHRNTMGTSLPTQLPMTVGPPRPRLLCRRQAAVRSSAPVPVA